MKVKIEETGEVVDLVIVDKENGEDYAQEILEYAGQMRDRAFRWSIKDKIYVAHQEVVNWWTQYFEKYEYMIAEVRKLVNEYEVNYQAVMIRISMDMNKLLDEMSDPRTAFKQALLQLRNEFTWKEDDDENQN